MSRYRVRGMGREFVVIADSETNAVKKLKDSSALKDANVIPRNAKRLKLTAKTVSSAGKPGDVVIVEKDEFGDWVGTQNGKRYLYLVSNIRNPNYYDVEVLDSAIRDDSTSVREWYMRTYPSDKLGKEIRPDLTWYDVYEAKFIYKVADMYRIIGIEDSVVRERIEAQLNRIKKDLGKNNVNRDSAIEEEMDIEDLDETIYGSGEYIEEKLKDSDYIDYNGGTIRIVNVSSGAPKGIKCEFYKKYKDFYDLIKWYPIGTPFNKVVDDFKRYINNHIKDSKTLKDSKQMSMSTIREIMAHTKKDLIGKPAHLMETIGHYTPSGANWSYLVGYTADNDLVVTRYGYVMGVKDSAIKDAVHTTNIDYVSADAAKKAVEVLKRAGYDAMLKTPTKVIVNTDKDISDFVFNKTDGVFICSNEG